ncbi:hypothetical protein FACS1894104_4230 [Actinomycetota bacterium]|nr:hypothetical protein FACS1894104_4230 [Actinomycetota bacterium]
MYVHFGKAFHGDNWTVDSAEDYLINDIKAMGYTWEELSENVVGINTIGGFDKYKRGMIKPNGDDGFSTPTGLVELYSTMYEGGSPFRPLFKKYSTAAFFCP